MVALITGAWCPDYHEFISPQLGEGDVASRNDCRVFSNFKSLNPTPHTQPGPTAMDKFVACCDCMTDVSKVLGQPNDAHATHLKYRFSPSCLVPLSAWSFGVLAANG